MKLTKKQLIYINARLANPDMSDNQISKDFGVSRTLICKWRQSQEFLDEIDKRLREQWKGAVVKAQKKMIELMDSQKDEVAIKAASYIMDSNGYKATEKVELDANVNTIKVSITND